jgi:signal transduction histidine kinase
VKHKILIFLLFLCLLPEAPVPAQPAGEFREEKFLKKPFNVLIISSYSSGYTWSDEIIDYIGSNLMLSEKHNYEISLEYLASEYQQDPQYWRFRLNVIMNSYRKQPPDLIVLVSDEAWFAFRHAWKKYYENVPVLLVAVKSASPAEEQLENPDSLSSYTQFAKTTDLLRENNATGIIRELNIGGVISLMDTMVDDLREVAVITDSRLQGVYTSLMTRDVLENERKDLKGRFIKASDVSTDSLFKIVSGFGDTTAMILSSWFTPGYGFNYSMNYVYSRISKVSSSPMFGVVAKAVENGYFAGGYFMPENFWGSKALKYIEKIAAGVLPASLPAEVYTDSQCHLNWTAVKRYNLNTENLPDGAKFFDKPTEVFRKYRIQIIVIGSILIIMIIAALLLTRSYLLIKAARKRLLDSEDNLYKALKKAQESDKLKSAFLANMSHEIRTPLNSILGFTELLSETTEESEREQYQRIIASSSDMLLRLIDDILDLSKIEAGTYEFVFEPADVCEILNELRQVFADKAQKGVEFTVECRFDELVIYADIKRIFQVLTNLVSNAIKFTKHGFIKVVCDSEEFDGERFLVLIVEDSGLGIPEEKIPTIFQRFVKLNDLSDGTGLGLTICSTIVKKHNGTIQVKSKQGSGTKFIVRIPVK